MKKAKKQPKPREAKPLRKLGANKPNPKHKRDFEGLLDLAVKGQK